MVRSFLPKIIKSGATLPEDGCLPLGVVKLSIHSCNQKNKESKDLGQIWDSAEEAKKAEWEKNPIIFILILKPHRWPNP